MPWALLLSTAEAGRLRCRERLVPRVCVIVCDSWGVGDLRTRPTTTTTAPTPSGIPRAPSRGSASRARGPTGLRIPRRHRRRCAACRTRLSTRTGHGAVGREGHHDRPLGDDGDPARRAVSAVSERVPTRGDRAVRGGDRSRDPRQRRPRVPRSSPSWASTIWPPDGRSCTRAATLVMQIAAHVDIVPLSQLYGW